MTKLIFVTADGQETEVSAEPGGSVMQAAVDAMVPGIEAACGGNCVCATCHCYFDVELASRMSAPDGVESDMLQCVAEPRAGSRLTCQVVVSDILEGARIEVASQH